MRLRVIDEHKFARKIADLLVDSEDNSNPNPENNAYNWGLINAERALRGVSVRTIRGECPDDLSELP